MPYRTKPCLLERSQDSVYTHSLGYDSSGEHGRRGYLHGASNQDPVAPHLNLVLSLSYAKRQGKEDHGKAQAQIPTGSRACGLRTKANITHTMAPSMVAAVNMFEPTSLPARFRSMSILAITGKADMERVAPAMTANRARLPGLPLYLEREQLIENP